MIGLNKKYDNLADEILIQLNIVPKEYNIINGLIGLGPDIMLDILSEMIFIPNAIQFVGYPIAVHNPDPIDIEFSDGDGVMKRITKKQNNWNTISLTQILDNGITSLEVEFNTVQCDGNEAIGIVRNSFSIPTRAHWQNSPQKKHIAVFSGINWGGYIYYKGYQTPGNIGFGSNQIVKLEYNSEKGTLTYFLDNVQQPVYITGIKDKVRFVIYMYYSESTCTIRSFKKLTYPTAVTMIGEKAVHW
ncbi:MAG: hypothetical protein EZS28_006003 [Streblomastix strix]|uniref:SPRY domain-containing protein n=1 Tax=Streblomastix strix TaxID=222440 RepID=A0A5J4WU33_9EUKA|nr:MAG: hypothetical protein EZS28_006003 [Streblomastix strix]